MTETFIPMHSPGNFYRKKVALPRSGRRVHVSIAALRCVD
jgi:hypothetical protein